MEWIKLNTRGILRGSLVESKDIIQLVWVKLLCLMNETKFRNGRFEYASGKPYPLNFIAVSCGVSQEILEGCICEYQEDINPDTGEPRVRMEDDGTLVIVNWDKYQSKPEKLVAKEEAIAEAKRTNKTKKDAINALIASVYELNKRLQRRFEVRDNGEVVDTATGHIISLEELRELQKGRENE